MSKKKTLKVKGAQLEQAMPKAEDNNDWQAEDHLRTLMSAHEIMNNPEHMKKVHKLAGRKAKSIRGIQDIKDHYNSEYGGKNAMSKLAPQEPMEGSGDGDE